MGMSRRAFPGREREGKREEGTGRKRKQNCRGKVVKKGKEV